MESVRSTSNREKRTVRPPKRYRTEEVLDFLDDSDNDCDGGLADSSDSYSESDRSSDSETEDVVPATPQPSTSSTRSTPATSRSTTPGPTVGASNDWTEATQGEETQNQFRFLPTRPPGVQPGYLDDNCSPIEAFTCLFTVNIIDALVESINSYAEVRCQQNNPARKRSRFANWIPVTRAELYKFFALLTLMGLDPRPVIKDYWSRTWFYYTPGVHQLFSRERFLSIFQTMLHTGLPEAQSKDKIEPFIDSLCKRFNEVFTPFKQLSIDEMIVGYKGRWQYKQFNASKPHKYHIKSFGLVDSTTGYVLQTLTYYGANTSYHPDCDPDSGMAIRIFDTLLKDIGTGYHIFADRWYTTRALVDHLTQKKLYYTGTVQTNRKNFPAAIKTQKLQHMEAKYFKTADDKLLCVSFKDKKAKKPVNMVSNNAKVEAVQVRGKLKPAMVDSYNQFMNGCDRADQNLGYYGVQDRKSKKWWEKLYFWALEIVHVNAFTLYKIQNNPTPQQLKTSKFSLKGFKEAVMKGLVDMYVDDSGLISPLAPPEPGMALPGRPDPLPLERLSSKQHLIRHTKNDTKCQYCPKRTGFICIGCEDKPHLHPNGCFEAYHI